MRYRLSRLLARLFGADGNVPTGPVPRNELRRILVARVNERLGNMLFLTSLVRSLAASAPDAEIDVVVVEPDHAELFRTLPGISQVLFFPPRKLLSPLRLFAFHRAARRRRYDLAIDPANNSFSNRMLVFFARPRWSAAFQTRTQWLPLTHAVAPSKSDSSHEVLKPLRLLSAVFAPQDLKIHDRMSIGLTASELELGRKRLQEALTAAAGTGTGPILGFFTEATGRKRIDQEWWRAWVAAIEKQLPQVRLVQILPPGGVQPLRDNLATICLSAHRELAAVLAHMDVFVSADAGPMHLASAAGCKVAALFVATKPGTYGPLGDGSVALKMDEHTPESVAATVSGILRP
jgi:ADP-heptose:LPS heptosyltransferase